MVQLVEVEDEHFQQPQAGPEEDEEDFTDTGTAGSIPPIPPLLAAKLPKSRWQATSFN
jgi:import receptor subunit TOM22